MKLHCIIAPILKEICMHGYIDGLTFYLASIETFVSYKRNETQNVSVIRKE